VESICLPVKAFVGHVIFLVRHGLSLLLVPQLISVFRREWTCANLLGLPDLVRQYVSEDVRLLTPVLDARRRVSQHAWAYLRMGLEFSPPARVLWAWQRARDAQQEYDESRIPPAPSRGALHVLLLGPHYVAADPYLNGNLRAKLAELGVQVSIAADFPETLTAEGCRYLRKRPYWTNTRRSIGSLEYCRDAIDGVISAAPFGCGAEAMQSVLISSHISEAPLPHLQLFVDEHSGTAGLETRLEAFCDLLERKRNG